jgi:hypothetical protein
VTSLPLDLAVHVQHANGVDLHAEEAFDGLLDLGLGRVAMHFEAHGVLRLARGRLLRDQRTPDHLVEVFHGSSLSSSLTSASRWTSTFWQSRTS